MKMSDLTNMERAAVIVAVAILWAGKGIERRMKPPSSIIHRESTPDWAFRQVEWIVKAAKGETDAS